MPDGNSVRSACPETNRAQIDSGTLCLEASETPTPVGYEVSLSIPAPTGSANPPATPEAGKGESWVQKRGRVDRAKELYKAGKVYELGCSEFVRDVLRITVVEDAETLMGDQAHSKPAGSGNKYPGLQPGDIVGWTKKQATVKGQDGTIHAHVAVYIGEESVAFIDANGEGARPREVRHGYGDQPVYKSRRL